MTLLADETAADPGHIVSRVALHDSATAQWRLFEQFSMLILSNQPMPIYGYDLARVAVGVDYVPIRGAARVSAASETTRDIPSPVQIPQAISHFLWERGLQEEIDATAARGSQVEEEVIHPTSEASAAARRFVSTLLRATDMDTFEQFWPYEIASLPNEGIEMVWKVGPKRMDLVFDATGALAYLLVEETNRLPRMREEHDVTVERALERLWSLQTERGEAN